jgi:hypothetical protein
MDDAALTAQSEAIKRRKRSNKLAGRYMGFDGRPRAMVIGGSLILAAD